MADNSVSAGGGIGLAGILTIIFVIFKLLGKITWSWWWVFAPLWIPLCLALIIFVIIIAGIIIAAAIKK